MAVNQKNLDGEANGTGQQEYISLVDAAGIGAAQQIQADYGGNQAEHRVPSRLLPEEQAQEGHKYDIHGRQKARLPRIGVDEADLL